MKCFLIRYFSYTQNVTQHFDQMKSKTKYLLLILSIVGLSLILFNEYKAYSDWSIVPELELSKGLFVIGIISFGLYFLIKKWRKVLTKVMIGAFSLCLAQNLYLVAEYYRITQSQKRLSEYSELNTCEEMENRFAADLKNDKIKYFSFGLVSDEEFTKKMKSEFGIENFNLGCTVYSEKICYNKLVEKHIEENYAKSINKLTE